MSGPRGNAEASSLSAIFPEFNACSLANIVGTLAHWLTLDAVPLRLVAELLEEEAAAVLAAEDLPAGQLARPHHLGAGGRGGAENLPDAGPAAGLQHLRGQWPTGP